MHRPRWVRVLSNSHESDGSFQTAALLWFKCVRSCLCCPERGGGTGGVKRLFPPASLSLQKTLLKQSITPVIKHSAAVLSVDIRAGTRSQSTNSAAFTGIGR